MEVAAAERIVCGRCGRQAIVIVGGECFKGRLCVLCHKRIRLHRITIGEWITWTRG